LKSSPFNQAVGKLLFGYFKLILPISVEVPPLQDLISGNFSKEKADEIMRWICGIDFEIDDVPEEFLGDYIILVGLVRTGNL
jgi:hypothetical protein